MASQQPPSIRHTPQASTRLYSAPPANAMSITAGRLSAATGQDGEQTSETMVTSVEQDPTPNVVKAEPQSGASNLQTVPAVSSDAGLKQHEGPPKKEEDRVADMSLSELPQKPKQITLDNLRTAIDAMDLANLKVYTETACQVLDALRQPMADSKQLEWLKRIKKIREKPQKTRTIVAVAGATGAGKSSLINALLDEEKLLPTSGFRACTAVVTEISYNNSNDPQKAYRAEVEFISQADWHSELNLLFADMVEDEKLSAAYRDANVEAGIAHAKICAVYPDQTNDMLIEKGKAEQLFKREAVLNVLGTTRKISCKNAQDLYKEIRSYLDSKDKDTEEDPKKEKKMAYWPLIKVVKVYTRASVLKQGICLVDLPGIHDANAARSAVATKYMAQASCLWVAAPIKRAVDDEAARKLLGMSSRLQMKLDGMYSSMSFVCTNTDIYELEETLEAFDEDGQIRDIDTRAKRLNGAVQEMKQAVEHLQEQIDDENTALDGIEREIHAWTALQKQQNAGQQVYPPLIPAKRKRGTRSAARKRRQEVVNDDTNEGETADRPPLTASEISWKLADLEHNLRTKTSECEDMDKRLETMEEELSSLEHEKDEASVESPRLCVQKRNQHVRRIVRTDFGNGIREWVFFPFLTSSRQC